MNSVHRNLQDSLAFVFWVIVGFGVSFSLVLTVWRTLESNVQAVSQAGSRARSSSLAIHPSKLAASEVNGFAICKDEPYCVRDARPMLGNNETDDTSERNTNAKTKQQVLFRVSISPESRVKATTAISAPRLGHQRWTEYIMAIENAAGVKSHLQLECGQFMIEGEECSDRWLRVESDSELRLSGEPMEYRTVRLWSRDTGKRAAVVGFNVGQGTQDLGFRSDVLLMFDVDANE